MSRSSPSRSFATIAALRGRGRGSRLRALGVQRLSALGGVVFVLLIGVAIAADFLACDRPVLLFWNGKLFVAPNLTDPGELRAYTNQSLLAAMDERDWAVFPVLAYGPNQHVLSEILAPPSRDHPLGTDSHGRDVLSRLVHGTRASLLVAGLAVSLAMAVGTLVGGLAGYLGGWVDLILMRLVEVIHSLPLLLLVASLSVLWAPRGRSAVWVLILVLGLTGWTTAARLLRAETLRVRGQDYIVAAKALGCSPVRVLVRHVLPNAMSPLLVTATFAFAAAILVESALSFLGLGVPPDVPSWGGLLHDGRRHLDAWWLSLFPGVAIFIAVSACHLVGQGVRDAFDPWAERGTRPASRDRSRAM